MIELESIARYRKADGLVILGLAFLWSVFCYLISLIESYSVESFGGLAAFLLGTSFFVCLTALLVRKLGAVTLFYLLVGFLTYPLDLMGEGAFKIFVLVAAGVIFEVFLLVLRVEVKNIFLSLVVGAGVSLASMPWAMLLLISEKGGLGELALNLSLLGLILGVMGAVLAFLAWYWIKGTKAVIRFEYGGF